MTWYLKRKKDAKDAVDRCLTGVHRWILRAMAALDQGRTWRAKLLLLDADAAITLDVEDLPAEEAGKLVKVEEKIHRALQALNRGDLEAAKRFLAEAEKAAQEGMGG
jgi:hypothetical protein